MRPLLLGVVLVLHALAQAAQGMWAAERAPGWIVAPLWLVAMMGFLAAGFAVLGLERLKQSAAPLALAALIAEAALARIAGLSPPVVTGVCLGAILAILVRWWARCCHPEIHTPTIATHAGLAEALDRPSVWRRLVAGAAWSFLAVTALLITLRPWHRGWGTTPSERSGWMSHPGDVETARFGIDRGVTIRAPAERVWPWLAQLGEDRAGFYSHGWVERALVGDVRNADSLVPAWQSRKVGELVRAARPGRLGGRVGRVGRDLGWRITSWDPPRTMTLARWGTFVVRPIDDSTSRLLVHARPARAHAIAALPLAWLGLYFIEPAHFVMERRMLLGIRERAERDALATLPPRDDTADR